MNTNKNARKDRRYSASRDDQRDRFERDRDRILYSSAFRRLAGVTEIVRAGEADVFHTRQQHTLKVAQVGRRLAEICEREQAEDARAHGVNSEVVEAACLAHDLGHPPFGHAGEKILDQLVVKNGDPEGYEGNAQSFRIVTKLATRFDVCPGLDLTRATLAACLKYPWFRDPKNPKRSKKWSAYKSEKVDFEFARGDLKHAAKSAEAELMDWADDIAYSVHDLEDFHRCGALPWHRIFSKSGQEDLVRRAKEGWWQPPEDADGRLRDAFRSLETTIKGTFAELIEQPYEGTPRQRQQLRTMNSTLIARYIRAIKLKRFEDVDDDNVTVEFDSEKTDEVLILKQITRNYIIDNPTLAAQQKGQGRIISDLFEDLMADSQKAVPPSYIPMRLRCFWDPKDDVSHSRRVADCISSLSESEALGLHGRLRGISSGSVLDPIVR